jgi:hypothetical protein
MNQLADLETMERHDAGQSWTFMSNAQTLSIHQV